MFTPPRTEALLVHLASGIGNIVLATPLLALLSRRGYTVDVRIDGDYPETADLLRGWGALRRITVGTNAAFADYRAVLPAIPPYYWPRYAGLYRYVGNTAPCPPAPTFYQNEQAWYLAFANAFGGPPAPAEAPHCVLPIAPDYAHGVSGCTLVLAPGCKSGDMAAKRWPHFAELAECFTDVAAVGTEEDLIGFAGTQRRPLPAHVISLIGQLSLRQTAEVIAAAGAVVANDSGLGHVAAAVGVATVLLFGPTPAAVLGRFPPNVTVLASRLACSPCWFGRRFIACDKRIDCLDRLTPSQVVKALHEAGFPG
jgi:ADP-heptose:LPS heptosyltransferase